VLRQVEDIVLDTPGVVRAPVLAGFSGATRTISASAGALFPVFEPYAERAPKGLTAQRITADLRHRLARIDQAFIVVIPPPPVVGIGTGGGFAMRIQDRDGRGLEALAAATSDLVDAARGVSGATSVFTPFAVNVPQLFVEVDRTRAEMLNVPVARITDAVETYFGSTYVNDFNVLGRAYRVTAQADLPFRTQPEDLMRLRAQNEQGQMVPLGSLLRVRDITAPDRVARYNLYPAAEISGEAAPGVSSGTALATMARLADQLLPDGFGFEWTELSYQQTTAGNTGLLVFRLSVLFVYLVLAAQYGSWSLPLAVILIVPMCLLSATIGVRLFGQDINILTQIGFVVLVGLASKNAILIVEFARQLEAEGRDRVDAVVEACRLRLRPILMTSFAFILGVLPLMLAEGAGAEMRQAVGTAVFFGMLGVTLFGLVFTPVFYVLIRRLTTRGRPVQAQAVSA
jgi:multidrug efflux pump subunit AcrB